MDRARTTWFSLSLDSHACPLSVSHDMTHPTSLSLPPDLRCISKPPTPLDPEQATPWIIFAMGRAPKRSLAGRKNQKKGRRRKISSYFVRSCRSRLLLRHGSAEGKCYFQALTREVSRVDEMMQEMRDYNEKTKHIEKLANKSKQ